MKPPCLSNPVLFIYLIAAVEAYLTFETTCSIPSAPVGYVSSPDARGTLDILWSSLFTIVACTWTIQHLNVPEQRDGRDPGWRGYIKWQMKSFYKSTTWMIITIIAPEMIIGFAFYDLSVARMSLRKLREFVAEDQVPWTLIHSYYANMGGFVIRSMVQEPLHEVPYINAENIRDNGRPGSHNRGRAATESIQRQSAKHRSEASSRTRSTMAFEYKKDCTYQKPYHLTARQIYQLRHRGILPYLPHMSKAELDDRSKNDYFLKAVAIIQVIWTIVQITVRTARKLAVSQLELAVIAFAACAIVIHILYWLKPKDVNTTTTILQYQGEIPGEVLELIKSYHIYMAYLLKDDKRKVRYGSPLRNDSTESYYDEGPSYHFLFAIFLGATLFGAIHVGAWNFDFPTRIELILWRCSSLYSAVWGPSILLIGILLNFSESAARLHQFHVQLSTILYIIARLILLVEIFRTLCFLPSDAFVSTWATNIPHVA